MTDRGGAVDITLRTTIADGLADQLRTEIRTGRIAAGSRLRQVETAERFNVSTTPVREAFAVLEREGMLVSSPHRGMVVFKPTLSDLAETYVIRNALETLAIAEAVERITDADLDALGELIKRMEAARDNVDVHAQLDLEFHSRIHRIAQHPRLERMIDEMRMAQAAYLRLWANRSWTVEQTHDDHVAIYQALRSRKKKAATKAMSAHLRHVAEHIARDVAHLDDE